MIIFKDKETEHEVENKGILVTQRATGYWPGHLSSIATKRPSYDDLDLTLAN